MDFKKTITLLAVMCAFSSFGQELIAPYNMMKGNNVDVIDTVPADEIWKVESIGSADNYQNQIIVNGELIRVTFQSASPWFKLPFWLNSGDVISIPHKYSQSSNNNSNSVTLISILRFKKPD